ncbi:MAG: bifunctional DNA-binding transcriptional regulator/O6-methylguanine-DNA methyltransferase Ada [Acidobacteriia bacterium]|nr:bifunctional DNA-binding transcriptional regulator/O6-methylguanine-DNA methyltransferase Ada [Terriglobia bacterium]
MGGALTGQGPRPWKSRWSEETAFWRGVLARDRRLDGAFVFAVRSTGIYCRPSCPARRPTRRQVVFFPLPEAAERAGFRPCRRCRPEEAAARDPQADLVRRVCLWIETSGDAPVSLQDLAGEAGVSSSHLQRTFKRLMGISPREYAAARRLQGLKVRLREGQGVTRALYEAGYGSSSRLYERSSAQLGMTPASYRKGGRGMDIGYTIVDSPLGRMLVGATRRGVCAVSLGEADAVLEAALVAEYPHAEIHRDDTGFAPWVRAIQKHLDGFEARLNLSLDLQATAFQRRVWKELQRIPYGRTRTYREVACAMGQPKAVRAVARACATNPVSIVVPCHRVIRGDGSLAGYRWGLSRKQALIEAERKRRGERRASAER